MRKKKLSRTLAMAASMILCASMAAAPVYAADSQEKEETVYVKADAEGNTQTVIVSDWLKNKKKSAEIKDATDLNDIENVKGDETFQKGGKHSITWDANGNDIYYQGKTDKELPVSMQVTYYLDGKEISPKDLVGKSGKVRVRYEFTNHDVHNGIYTPFTMITAVVLPTEHFSNVKMENAKDISDGSKHILMGVAFPGLSDSLKLKDSAIGQKFNIPDSFEFTADVKDFQMTVTATVASADTLSEFGLDKADSIDELNDSLTTLSNASEKLVNGSGELLSGVKELRDASKTLKNGTAVLNKKTKELSKGLNTLDDKKDDLISGAKKLSKGTKDLKAGTSELEKKTKSLPSMMKELASGLESMKSLTGSLPSQQKLQELASGLDSITSSFETIKSANIQYSQALQGQIDSLTAMLGRGTVTDASDIGDIKTAIGTMQAIQGKMKDENDTIDQQSKALSSSLAPAKALIQKLSDPSTQASFKELSSLDTRELTTAASSLRSAAVKLNKGAGDLSSGQSSLVSGTNQLGQGIHTAASGGKKLSSATGTLASGGSKLSSGTDALYTGADTLNTGLIQFNQDGIKRLVNIMDHDVQNTLDRINDTVKQGDKYQTFTKKAKGTKGSVKFMIETEEIE